MTTTDAATAALIAGLTTRGMDHGMTADYARHVLEVLEDAGIAVTPLPEATNKSVTSGGVRIAHFGSIIAYVYPEPDSWLVHADSTGDNGCWDEQQDHAAVAAGILAASRWARSEANKK